MSGKEALTKDKKEEKKTSSPKKKPASTSCLYSAGRYVEKYFQSASIDGIDHVTEGKSVIRRIMWAIILVISLAVCLFFLIEHGTDFARKPTSTTLDYERDERGLPFPAVTICNLNPVSRSYAQELGIDEFLRRYFISSKFFEDNRELCGAILESANLTMSTLSFDELFRNGGRSLNELVLHCTFSVNRTVSTDCFNSLVPIITDLGQCYTFNSDSNNLPDTFFQVSGSRYGLRMVVNISQNDYITSADYDAGLLVSVHARDTFSDPFERGIAVPPGRHARIGVQSQGRVDRTGKGQCVDSDTKLPFFPNTKYSTSTCRANARYKYVADDSNCNCTENPTSIITGLFPDKRNCTLADACCLAEADVRVESTLNCPPPCEFITYDTSVSYSKFPYSSIEEVYAKFTDVDFETVEEDLVSFNVFFADLYSDHAETIISYGPRLLVADIGGTLGLFLGASIISFMEILVLFYDELKILCCISKKVRHGWDEFELKLRHPGKKEKDNEMTEESEDEKKGTEKSSEV